MAETRFERVASTTKLNRSYKMKILLIITLLTIIASNVEASERISSQEFHLAWTKGKVCLVEDGEIDAASDKLLNTLIVDYANCYRNDKYINTLIVDYDNCYRSDVTIINSGQINDDIYRDAMNGEY